ncbi:acyltransferase family protein [Kytococcus sedentarius]|uniref:acyltransferase family protein n=1 Tax=Kytococcus sedentarius TaxID=1276 RepID=UPI0038797A7A
MSAVAPAPPAAATGGRPAGFRPDVEGLRAIAVLSVLAYHAGLPLITGGFGGVDVFFVLSGFLITGQLLKEVDRTGTVDLPAFYGRRAKRLLPAATMVLLFTAIGTWLIFPITRFKDIAWDLGASAVYLINWRLADQSVDYLAEDTLPSPVQHYWSLAVEEQFYVVWPLVLLVVGLVVTRTRRPLAPVATIGLLAIAVPSLVWSVLHTADSPDTAYFVTTTRLWELALGGLVACGAAVWPRIAPRLASILVLGGLVALLASFFVITSSTPWPGTAALLPTVATALVLVGGAAASGGLVRVLGSAPMLWVGALSYSLYLWHWPLVTFVNQGFYDGDAPLWATTAAVLAAFPLAWLGHRLIENPVRFAPVFKRTRNALSLGAGLSVLGALGAVALVTLSPGTPSSPTADPKQTDERVGAEALLPEGMDPQDVKATTTPVVTEAAIPDAPKSITPAVTDATKDYPVTKDEGCVTSVDGTDVKSCTFGDEDSDKVLVAAGDSKIDQWIPAIDDWGQANGYQVVTYFKSACPFNGELLATDDPRWQGCHDWGQQVNQEITALDPDILLTSSLMAGAGDNGEAKVVTGYEKVWTPLLERGTKVVVVDDTTSPGGTPVYECVAEHLDSVNECTFPDKGGRGSATLKKAVDAVDGAQFMSLNDFVCPEGTCRPVVGGVLTYRQGSHISDTYARTLSPMFGARLDAALAAAQ